MAAIITPRPTRLFHDYETKSRADLKKTGASRYSRDPSTRVQMVAWAFDDGEVRQWTEDDGERPPAEFTDALEDDRVMKNAWNAAFEKAITCNVLGIPVDHAAYTCTMTVANSLALPGKLEVAGKIIRLDEEFLKVPGKVFINKFAKPRKPTKNKPWEWASSSTDPFDWLEYCFYNRRDVMAERAIWKKVRKYDFNATERALYELDQEINEAGIPINLAAVRGAIRIRDHALTLLLRRMADLTGLDNPNSPKQLLPWLQERGYPFDDLKKGHIERALERVEKEMAEAGDNFRHSPEFEEMEVYAEVLDLRAQTSKTSIAKFDALAEATDTDGNLRGTFQFAGAGRTNRWAGRIFQPQNLAKPTKDLEKSVVTIARHVETLDPEEFMLLYKRPIDALSAAIRPMVQAGTDPETGEEMVFADSDLSAIENIVLGWSSGEEKITSVFEQGRDPYLDFGQYMYGVSYESLKAAFDAGDKGLRTTCKPGVLGCGYGLGKGAVFENEQTGELEATGLLGYAWNMKVKTFTLEDSEKSVRIWRETFTRAVEFWRELEDAAFRTVRTGKPSTAGPVEFRMETPFLRMYLPSGRALSYLRPLIQNRMTSWGKKKPTLTYEGMNSKRMWVRETTYGGKLTENVCQAIARDILGHGALLAKQEGLKLRLHVHDQLVHRGPASQAERDLRILKECMMAPPPWASDIPLNVGGFTSALFLKD